MANVFPRMDKLPPNTKYMAVESSEPSEIMADPVIEDERSDVPEPVPIQTRRDEELWRNCQNFAEAQLLNRDFFQGKRVGQNVCQEYDADQLNESGHQLLEHVFILQYQAPFFYRTLYGDSVSDEKHMGLCYYLLPYDSPLRLPFMKSLLDSAHLPTVLLDLSIQPEAKGVASNLFHCEGLHEERNADLIEYLEDHWEMIHDDMPERAAQFLINHVNLVKGFDCQAILGSKPTVFLTVAGSYDADLQKALLDLVNQKRKVLEVEEEERIRSQDLVRKEMTSKLFLEYGCTNSREGKCFRR